MDWPARFPAPGRGSHFPSVARPESAPIAARHGLLLLLQQPLLLFFLLAKTLLGHSLQPSLLFRLRFGFRFCPFLFSLPLGRLGAVKRHFATQALLFKNAGLHGLHPTALLFESPERQVIAERRNIDRQSRCRQRAIIIQA